MQKKTRDRRWYKNSSNDSDILHMRTSDASTGAEQRQHGLSKNYHNEFALGAKYSIEGIIGEGVWKGSITSSLALKFIVSNTFVENAKSASHTAKKCECVSLTILMNPCQIQEKIASQNT
jgi:hypothetical protein